MNINYKLQHFLSDRKKVSAKFFRCILRYTDNENLMINFAWLRKKIYIFEKFFKPKTVLLMTPENDPITSIG